MNSHIATVLTLCHLLWASASFGDDKGTIETAQQVLEETNVQGGLIVHVGCGEGKLTAALLSNDRYVVHGLDRESANVDKTREHLRSLGKHGKATADVWMGKTLPYTDNLVNLLIVESPDAVSREEMMRVLCPEGVAYVKSNDGWSKVMKPWPSNIDEWSHYLHGPDNNAVAKDTVVGSPNHLQWVGGPKWARGHEVLATISIVISAGGRVFYIADEGPTASVDLPSKWNLIARDAFNGIVLWKRPIPQWESTHRPFRSGPTHLPRRLVAVGDTVFVTLGFGEPVVAIDGATGEILRTFAGTEGTEEIIAEHGLLFLVAGDPKDQQKADLAVRRGQPIPPVAKRVIAVDPESGKTLWTKADTETADLFAQTLAVSNSRVFMQNTRAVLCLDAKTGEQLWRKKRPAALSRPAWSVPTLVVYSDVVLSADRQAPEEAEDDTKPQRVNWSVSFQGGNAPPGELIAYSASDGKRLWATKCKEGYNAPVDVLLADGLLWSGDLVRARDPGITEARDPLTGKVVRTRPNDQNYFTPGMSHHRCYRNRATENFVLLGRSGVEFVDLKTGKAEANHWVRGTCQFGVIPANGLLYAPPHTCACYVKTKLNGFNALAPKRPSSGQVEDAPRLTKGPAFDKELELEGSTPLEWPTYRHDASRSGGSTAVVPAKVKKAWQTEIGGKLSSVVAGNTMVFVARVDDHSVHALDASRGKPIWSFTAGGAIDSPPTVYTGRVLFGSTDGHVYCLDSTYGELIWRFRAGPEDRRVMIDGSLESAWPVHGNILIEDKLAYFAAGRSSFLDGGIFLFALNPNTGEVVHRGNVSGRDPKTGQQPKDIISGFDMPGGLPDILSSDGKFIYMRDLKFDDQLKQQTESGDHLFSPTGFLDDSWWHRSYCVYGSEFKAGWPGWHQVGNIVPAGKLLAFNDKSIYGFGRNVMPSGNAGQWTTGEYYRLFGAAKSLKPVAKPAAPPKGKRRGRQPVKSRVNYHWSERVAPTVRAMVLANDTLFIAGPVGDTHKSLDAFEGKEGIVLQAVSTADGKVLSETTLDSLPVFDGMAAAYGRLYLPTVDGSVTCFAGE